jgi:hypothetical protein
MSPVINSKTVSLEIRRRDEADRLESSAITYLSPYNVTPPQNTIWPPCRSDFDATAAVAQQNWHHTGKGVPDSALICTASRDRPYQSGRSKHWIKVKNRKHQAFDRVQEAHRRWSG